MADGRLPSRRNVLRSGAIVGGGLMAGGAALTGTAGARGKGNRWGTYAWVDDEVMKMTDDNLPVLYKGDPEVVQADNTEKLYVVGAQDHEDSPHPNPDNLSVDHVAETDRKADRAIYLVIRPENAFEFLQALRDPATAKPTVAQLLSNLPTEDGFGNKMTSAATIENAINRLGAPRWQIPLETPESLEDRDLYEPLVFNSNIRPNRDQ